jgi:integrase
MELALVTAQRREDIAAMEFRKGKDSSAWVDDALYTEQLKSKRKNKLRIPLDVGVNGWTIGAVVKSCRDDVMSKWLIHHQVAHTGVTIGNQVWLDTITKGFSRASKLAGVIGEGKTPPSFHEIRSLAIRIYANQYGQVFAQAIAGHKDAATSALYRDNRGAEWVQVKAG